MLYVVFIYLSLLFLFSKQISKKVSFLLSLLPLVLIVWTRYGIGADYFSYQDMYYSLNTANLGSLISSYPNVELGFKLLISSSRYLKIPYHVFLSIVNTLVLFVLAKWIQENSPKPELSILLFYSMFYLVWVLSALRQSIVLAFGLYFLFNKEKELDPLQMIIFILFLSLFHRSALILFVLILLREIKWTKKAHLIFMGIALLTTFLPLAKILSPFSFVPGINKIINYYLDDSVIFYDFPGLIRLLIFSFLIIFYDEESSYKMYLDSALYGFSIYFLLKFSELTASRGTIYSFFLIIIIIPYIIDEINYNKSKRLQIFLAFFIVIGSSIYFTKEFKTMFTQSFYLPEVTWKSYPNIKTGNISDFGSTHSYTVYLKQVTQELKETYDKRFNERGYVDFNIDDDYYTVKVDGYYGIINQEGKWLLEPEFPYEIKIIDGILVKKNYHKKEFFIRTDLTDLTGEERSYDEMLDIVIYASGLNDVNLHIEERISKDISDLPQLYEKFYPDKAEIEDIVVNKIISDQEFYLIRVQYLNRRTFVYLNKEYQPLVEIPMLSGNMYRNGFLEVATHEGKAVLNSEGEIIWWD